MGVDEVFVFEVFDGLVDFFVVVYYEGVIVDDWFV